MLNKNNKTSFDYSGTEYFSILIDQLNTGRKVLSIIAEEENTIMPHMETHFERINSEGKRNLTDKIDQIIKNPHPEINKSGILKQLNIFKRKLKNIK